jgi:hypothetical protein
MGTQNTQPAIHLKDGDIAHMVTKAMEHAGIAAMNTLSASMVDDRSMDARVADAGRAHAAVIDAFLTGLEKVRSALAVAV